MAVDKGGGEGLQYVACDELGVVEVIQCSVDSGVSNGDGVSLDSNDLFGAWGKEAGYCSGSGVEVVECFGAGELGVVGNVAVEGGSL